MKRAVAIGTFDGVHRGHAAILRKAVQIARRKRWEPAVLTFRAPPRHYFKPEKKPFLLSTSAEKKALCESLGIRKVVELGFNAALARMSAEDFFERLLVRRLKAGAVLVGYNFGFGKGREGDAELLSRLGRRRGVQTVVVPEVQLNSEKVSSGRIRAMLARGDVRSAARLLGHPYCVTGSVVRGDGRGRTLGFPTANLRIDSQKIVPAGVFAVRCEISGDSLARRYAGMCNVGVRPTFKRGSTSSVEVHLFKFSGNLYGRTLRLEFIEMLRSEKRFAGPAALRRQLEIDRRNALHSVR